MFSLELKYIGSLSFEQNKFGVNHQICTEAETILKKIKNLSLDMKIHGIS